MTHTSKTQMVHTLPKLICIHIIIQKQRQIHDTHFQNSYGPYTSKTLTTYRFKSLAIPYITKLIIISNLEHLNKISLYTNRSSYEAYGTRYHCYNQGNIHTSVV